MRTELDVYENKIKQSLVVARHEKICISCCPMNILLAKPQNNTKWPSCYIFHRITNQHFVVRLYQLNKYVITPVLESS